MSYLLCHECYTWVDPEYGRCPQCGSTVDQSIPDPPLDALEMQMGEIFCRIGEVRVKRKGLPDRGMLYATTSGLFFLPHSVERVPCAARNAGDAGTLLWSLAACVWSPLAFVIPLIRANRQRVTPLVVLRPKFITPKDSHRLPVLLMENPGVFFVPKSKIRLVARRGRHWRLDRRHGAPLKLHPTGNRLRFHARMEEVLMTSTFQHLAALT